MAVTYVSTRRDQRYPLRKGSSFVEFQEPPWPSGPTAGALTRVSVAGLSFEIPASPALSGGTRLRSVTLRLGECQVQGDLVVRSCQALEGHLVEVGALFFPASPESEDTWMTLLAGIAVAAGNPA